jgi:hypothetical protein
MQTGEELYDLQSSPSDFKRTVMNRSMLLLMIALCSWKDRTSICKDRTPPSPRDSCQSSLLVALLLVLPLVVVVDGHQNVIMSVGSKDWMGRRSWDQRTLNGHEAVACVRRNFAPWSAHVPTVILVHTKDVGRSAAHLAR